MELKLKNREHDTLISIDTKLNRNTEHTITNFYKEMKDGEYAFELDTNGIKKEDVYLIKLVEDGETLEEIFVSDMDEIIQAEDRDNKELELGNKVLNEVLEGDE